MAGISNGCSITNLVVVEEGDAGGLASVCPAATLETGGGSARIATYLISMKRRHHTIPRSYLQRFANDRGQLRRTPLADPGSRHLVSVFDASVHKDFYIVEHEGGVKSDSVESLIGTIEAEGAKGLEALVDRRIWPVDFETRQQIALWAAALYLRAPHVRLAINELADQFFKLEVAVHGRDGVRRAQEEQLGRTPTPDEVEETWDALRDFDAYNLVQHPNEHMKLMLETLEGHTRVMTARSWTVVRFQRKTLMTCDSPVVLIPAADQPAWMGVGLLNLGGIVIPLDRRAALIMGDIPPDIASAGYGSGDVRIGGTSKLAAFVNDAVVHNAREVVFSHPDDDALLARDLPVPRQREVSKVDLDRWVAAGEQMRASRGVAAGEAGTESPNAPIRAPGRPARRDRRRSRSNAD